MLGMRVIRFGISLEQTYPPMGLAELEVIDSFGTQREKEKDGTQDFFVFPITIHVQRTSNRYDAITCHRHIYVFSFLPII